MEAHFSIITLTSAGKQTFLLDLWETSPQQDWLVRVISWQLEKKNSAWSPYCTSNLVEETTKQKYKVAFPHEDIYTEMQGRIPKTKLSTNNYLLKMKIWRYFFQCSHNAKLTGTQSKRNSRCPIANELLQKFPEVMIIFNLLKKQDKKIWWKCLIFFG